QVAPSQQLRFMIQKHDATLLHYDLRLEFDGVFKSWAVTRGPSLDPHDKRLAVEVEDHPLDYGDFEGTIPEDQYGGGTVQLWDRGYWESDDPDRGFRKGDLKFTLRGEKLHGSWVLVRMKGDRFGGKRTNWLLIKHRDEALRIRGKPADRRGLVPRDQVRRLPRAVARRGPRGRAKNPQGAGLDRQISSHRQGRRHTARRLDRRRDRRRQSRGRSGFFGAAGRDCRGQDRQSHFLRVRSVVRRPRRSSFAAAE